MKNDLNNRGIWVFMDLRSPTLLNHSLNVLSKASDLADLLDTTCTGVIPQLAKASGTTSQIKIDHAIDQAKFHGSDAVIVLTSTQGEVFLPHELAQLLHQAVALKNPLLVLFPLSDIVREIAARSAFLCHTGLIADCVDFRVGEHDEIIAICPSYGGEVMAELGFSDSQKSGFITVRPDAFRRKEIKKPFRGIDTVAVDLGMGNLSLERLSISEEPPGAKQLESAETVVVGGAGLGNIEGFQKVRKLASALGAELGATRPPVLWHWIDEDRLIGQTGKTIKPNLLISIGTSGAVQYTAGITGSKFIVAVNKDPEAPIFHHADIGIVEDANQLLPVLIDKIHLNLMQSLAEARHSLQSSAPGTDFGSKLMRIRQAHGISQEILADKTGKTPDFIDDIENNRTTPSVGFMIKLSEVFKVDPGTFLNEEDRTALSGKRAKEYVKRTGNYSYQNLTPGAENEHLRVFMVTIASRQVHKPVAFRHEGEEFIYVMSGKLELKLDEKNHILMPGESIKFNSEIPHKLKSLTDETTQCLVSLYTP